MMVKYLLFLVCLIGSVGVELRSQEISFSTINDNNGLRDNYVEHILEDNNGFLWFATHGGLVRYDGQNFDFVALPNQQRNITMAFARQYITYIAQDTDGKLWLGTLSGVYIYSPQSGAFDVLESDPSNQRTLSNNFVEQIVFDNRGNAWVATIQGLNMINRKTLEVRRFMHEVASSNSISHNHVKALQFDQDNILWVGTSAGLDRVNVNTFGIEHFNVTGRTEDSLGVRSIIIDSDRNVWVATPFEGLYFLRRGEQRFEKKVITRNGKPFTASFSGLVEDRLGRLWLGTAGDGIVVFDPRSGKTLSFQESSPEPRNLCGNSITRLTRDSRGNIWIATHGGGASVHKPFVSSFSYFAKKSHHNSLPYNLISCFEQDSNGDIWLGTDGGGFCKKNADETTFLSFTKKDGLTSNAVLDIVEIEPGLLAIATWNGGLNLFNTRTRKFTSHLFASTRKDKRVQDIYGLYFDRKNGLLWCCTYYDGIQLFDVKKRTFLRQESLAKRYNHWNHSLFSDKLMFDNVDGSMWVLEGQNLLNLKDSSYLNYSVVDSADMGCEVTFASDILQLNDGTVIVTSHKGIHVFHRPSNRFRLFKRDGIDFTEAKSIMQDGRGKLWVTTSKSLFRISLPDSSLQDLSKYWGMPVLQYYPRSSFRDSEGFLYFGSLKGFVRLHEDSTYSNFEVPGVFLTKILIHSDGQRLDKDNTLSINAVFRDTILLSHDQSFITIEYAAINYTDNKKTLFRYKLDGFDKDWVAGNAQRQATYTNIPPGRYTFMLQCTDSRGDWSKELKKVSIVVTPPWWKTQWFIFLIIVMIIVLIVLVIIRRERNIVSRNKYLESVVGQKTQELTAKNDTLMEQKMTIEASFEKLREKQLVIEIKNSQLQEAINTKDKLLTVIAHDFKNPLATLQGFSNVLRDKIYKRSLDDLKPNIDAIAKSADSLISQMVEILDWSVSNEDSVKYSPAHVNIEVLIFDVLLLVNETAQQKKIDVETECSFNSYAFVDPRMVSTVIRNLVINSTKFTRPGGKIKISVTETGDNIVLRVADNGIGMTADQIDAIITDKKVLSNQYRTGFGLQICKSFIARNLGKLTITSTLNEGSQFTVMLPKGKALDKAMVSSNVVHHLSADGSPETRSEQTMLIIDDEPDVVSYLRELFAPSFTVLVAYDGQDGLKLAQRHIPDVILSDINMPFIDGKQLCQQIKANKLTCHIPVILISAQALPHNQIDGLLHGADDYITKPFNSAVLKQKVTSMLKNRELLVEHVSKDSITRSDYNLPESIDDKVMREMNRIIVDNLTNPDFTVEFLADAVGMSRSQLYRKSKAVLGQSPIEFINNMKFNKAMEMIRTGKYRVSEVAYELGFSDARYFSSSFAKKFGGTPSSFYPKSDNAVPLEDFD